MPVVVKKKQRTNGMHRSRSEEKARRCEQTLHTAKPAAMAESIGSICGQNGQKVTAGTAVTTVTAVPGKIACVRRWLACVAHSSAVCGSWRLSGSERRAAGGTLHSALLTAVTVVTAVTAEPYTLHSSGTRTPPACDPPLQ
eukprot:4658216-Prymnesium_polylepis.1